MSESKYRMLGSLVVFGDDESGFDVYKDFFNFHGRFLPNFFDLKFQFTEDLPV